jgi:hypothetical protein
MADLLVCGVDASGQSGRSAAHKGLDPFNLLGQLSAGHLGVMGSLGP